MAKFQVIATLNSHLLKSETLESMVAHGATIFRINGSHIQPDELEHYAQKVRGFIGTRAKILVDLPGNKIRTAVLSQPILLQANKTFELFSSQVNYPEFFRFLSPGDCVLANDSLLKFVVKEASADGAIFLSHTDGFLDSNKGMHLLGKPLSLPFLFPRDRELIASARKNGLDYIGFSFVRTPDDVVQAQESLKGSDLRAIIKVETAPAVENLEEILGLADEFLVDRGDLSCDVGIENVERFQKFILERGRKRGKTVYFATQFLHSMLKNNTPLIAEACGLADAIRCGVSGIQLSEETAVGKFPIETLRVIERSLEANPRLGSTQKGAPVLWFTGPSGSGKTTICQALKERATAAGLKTCLVDGDDFRAFWGNDLGYTKEERVKNLRSIVFTAYQASQGFDLVLVSSLSPYRDIRDLARSKLANFHEVYVNCSGETCAARDPKGHYRKAFSGEHKNFVGVSEEYEAPLKPELTLNTENAPEAKTAEEAWSYLLKVSENASA